MHTYYNSVCIYLQFNIQFVSVSVELSPNALLRTSVVKLYSSLSLLFKVFKYLSLLLCSNNLSHAHT